MIQITFHAFPASESSSRPEPGRLIDFQRCVGKSLGRKTQLFARGVITPVPWEHVAESDELSRAREWLQTAKSDELDQPPENMKQDFVRWLSEIDSRAWPFAMRSRLSDLWPRVVTYAVGMALRPEFQKLPTRRADNRV